MGKNPKIIITGYPYAYPYYFKVFEYLKNREDFAFILPELWQAKKGKVQIKLEQKKGFTIYGTKTASYGGKTLLRGLFKGWMPAIALLLPYMRLKYGSRVLYSCSEPNLLTTLYNGLFAKLFGFKHVLFTWQNVPPEDRMSGIKLKLSNVLVKLNLSLADGIICGNKKAELIVRNLKPKTHNLKTIVCILSGVDIEKFKPSDEVQGKLGGFAEEKTILFYGALEDRKGLDVLIKAFSKISDIDAKLVIIGTGPDREKLVDLVEQYGIKDQVVFKDWMKNEDLPAILSESTVFVYPSVPVGGWEEQFGYAMGEASASEIPVIASRTGSIDEIVRDGETGILFEPKNVGELSLALKKILNDNELCRRMGRAGREYVVRNFSHEQISQKINNFLQSFI